ncbi:MAG TPA: hypothetical protein VGN72_01105 [Tepidisphaeraceae bacterium]|jgi:hypothetical protein|nr:hypothetical protein [Tepidisphaeraceae bacterium]
MASGAERVLSLRALLATGTKQRLDKMDDEATAKRDEAIAAIERACGEIPPEDEDDDDE